MKPFPYAHPRPPSPQPAFPKTYRPSSGAASVRQFPSLFLSFSNFRILFVSFCRPPRPPTVSSIRPRRDERFLPCSFYVLPSASLSSSFSLTPTIYFAPAALPPSPLAGLRRASGG